MAKTRTNKEKAVARLYQQLQQAKGVVFADFTGLLVKELQELRRELRKSGIYYEVVKKTLLRRSLQQAGLDSSSVDHLRGGVSVAVSQQDEVAPAKTLVEFTKKFDKLRVLGGIIEQRFVDENQVKTLSQLPSRPELISQLLGVLKGPLSGLVGVLEGNLRGLLRVLTAVAEKK